MSTETEMPTGPEAAPLARPAAADMSGGEVQVHLPHRGGLPPLVPYMRELWRRREFALELSRTKVRAQQYNTVLGQLWVVLNPLLLAGVYFLLIEVIRGGHGRGPTGLAHIVAGVFAFHLVSWAARDGAKSVVGSGGLILNTAFPRLILPISGMLTAFKRFYPSLPIYAVIHVAVGLPVGLHLLWVIPLLAMLSLVATGMSILFSVLQVYFRDLSGFLPYLTRLWMYCSPVLYYVGDIPERYQWLVAINPVGYLLGAYSDVLIKGVAPTALQLGVAAAWSVVILVGSSLFFMSRERDLALRL